MRRWNLTVGYFPRKEGYSSQSSHSMRTVLGGWSRDSSGDGIASSRSSFGALYIQEEEDGAVGIEHTGAVKDLARDA